jgi:enamine deaminase RidA (YjgF/YER057c/UK114 family)
VHYLYAPTHLNPTYEYGVAFERGVAIDFPTMRRVLISGTASINNCGQVVHCGDIRKQTERMLENIAALLAEAECDWSNVAHQIVYLRDIADYATVAAMLQQRFPDMPRVIVLAPVCRPDWLIEMEVMALK